MATTATEPQGVARGRVERFICSGKALGLSLVAAAGCASADRAQAQLVLPAIGPGGYGQPWHFGTGLEVDETYSDNINLSPRGQERSELVTTITPDFHMSRSGPRLNAILDYSPSFIWYARGTNGSTIRNALTASLNSTLIDNLLFFQGSAAISQQNVSPFGTQVANDINGSANRVESRTYSLGPTLRSRWSNDISYQLGYQYAWSNSDSTLYARNNTSTEFASLTSGTSFRDLGGTLSYNRTDQSYGTQAVVTEQENLSFTYVVTTNFKLNASIGRDDDSYPTTGQADLKGVSYSAGFNWNPSRQTTANVQFGHRYFGPTANVLIQQSMPHYAVTFAYVRDQSTSNGNGLTLVQDPNYALLNQIFGTSITDPILRAQAVQGALAAAGLPTSQFGTSPFISNQIFVQKRLEFSVALIGLRNTVTFDANRTETRGLSGLTVGFDIFNQASAFRTTGVSATWSHRLGPRTSVTAQVQRTQAHALDGTGDSTTRSITVAANRTISKHLSGSVSLRNTAQRAETNANGLFGGNYRENAIFGSLHASF